MNSKEKLEELIYKFNRTSEESKQIYMSEFVEENRLILRIEFGRTGLVFKEERMTRNQLQKIDIHECMINSLLGFAFQEAVKKSVTLNPY